MKLPPWLGWAMYLGCSWTWCIGMFLPVLLVRDYGIWGWIVFAIPNVLGAAAMGWVLRSPQASSQVVAAHRWACTGFSVVTIAFHLFFFATIVDYLIGAAAPAIVLALLFVFMLVSRMKGEIGLAFVVFACSILAWIVAVVLDPTWRAGMQGNHPGINLAMLAPICAFGFAFCPYLDLTFHKARQESQSPSESHRAFGIGFGVFFLLMILFTLFYAPRLTGAVEPNSSLRPPLGIFGLVIGLHMIIQSVLTLVYHGRQLGSAGLWLIAPIATLLAIAIPVRMIFPYAGLTIAEGGYRIFMAFYGLIFPAYVWICMIPGRGMQAPTKSGLFAWGIAVLIAGPMFWLAFIEGKMIWLLPGLGVVLLLGGVSFLAKRHSAT